MNKTYPTVLKEFDTTVVEKSLLYTAPQDWQYNELISETCVIADKQNPTVPLIGYFKLDMNFPRLLKALKEIKYSKSFRTAGLPTQSRIFGYSPRVTLRKDFCSATSLANENPKYHKLICDFGWFVALQYKDMNPDLYRNHLAIAEEKVLPEWRIKETPFTSGIINKTNPLRYHFDSGNFKNVWSCMWAVKKNIKGGHLVIPSLHIALDCDNALVMFDGQSLLHGVSPITRSGVDSYRFSIVYYSLQQMWNCGKVDEELDRIRKIKTGREHKRAGLKID